MKKDTRHVDPNKPCKLTENIWWVGSYLEGDEFQCHSYLIENGTDSILLDPGSMLTFPNTLKKIEEITPFSNIRYFVAHHQDPDITGALGLIDRMVSRDDARILSHWRAIALLKHLDLRMPMECVEKMGWKLKAGERELEFIFTPYLHFPGAFCSFDRKSGSLFSSDLAGGFTKEFSLFATDHSYLESIRLFHEHYMPSREILGFAVDKFLKLPLERILPQHGSVIEKEMIPFILDGMKTMDCGLYLMTQSNSDIRKLSLLNRFLQEFMKTLVFNRDFDSLAKDILRHIRLIIPAEEMSFLIMRHEREGWQVLEAGNQYSGMPFNPVPELLPILREKKSCTLLKGGDGSSTMVLTLNDMENECCACVLFRLKDDVQIDEETESVLDQIRSPLRIAIERELIRQTLDDEKKSFYEQSIKDNLTGLYNRTFLNETIPGLFSQHDRGVLKGIALLMLDLDHFKQVNDLYGHATGDQVLREAASAISRMLRKGDLPFRVGGEEFAVILILEEERDLKGMAERIRNEIRNIDFSAVMTDRRQTISGGLASREKGESLEDLFSRADSCLYKAKSDGRDRIVWSV